MCEKMHFYCTSWRYSNNRLMLYCCSPYLYWITRLTDSPRTMQWGQWRDETSLAVVAPELFQGNL